MPFYVLKMGGSLMPYSRELVRSLLALGEAGFSFLVVPGGGPMADLVRQIYSSGQLSQEGAHWMAILAMEEYAYFLADGTGAPLTSKISRHQGHSSLEILLPYQALLKDDWGLKHSWDYTSDAVAALIAAQLSSPLIKVTDVDGVLMDGIVVPELPAARLLGRESCIDQGTVQLLCGPLQGMRVLVFNGTDRDRFIIALREGRAGTIIT